jgi:hypothetical protein
LYPSKGTIGQKTTIFTGKWHTLRNALIYDVSANLCKTMYIGFPGSIITSFDGIIKESIYTVSIILVILGRIDASLRSDAVCSSRTVMEGEALYLVAQFTQGGSG